MGMKPALAARIVESQTVILKLPEHVQVQQRRSAGTKLRLSPCRPHAEKQKPGPCKVTAPTQIDTRTLKTGGSLPLKKTPLQKRVFVGKMDEGHCLSSGSWITSSILLPGEREP